MLNRCFYFYKLKTELKLIYMDGINNKEIAKYLVVLSKAGRKFTSEKDTRWGGLIEPAPTENPDKKDEGLRVVLFGSWDFGYLVLETLKEFENKYPGQLNLVGLVTDDPLNPDAKISLKKRIWHLLDVPHRLIDETIIIGSALKHGVPVYTGEIKVDSFHDILKKWNPDVILVCVFGQIIDSFAINLPRRGIYNFHPSDLSLHQGAGPAPYDDLLNRHAETGLWSVHYVSEEVDGGKVVGKSPDVKVVDVNNELPANPIIVYHKLAGVLSSMAFYLMQELVRNFEINKEGRIDRVDFNSLIPDSIKNIIMQPVTNDSWPDAVEIPEGYLYKSG